MIAEILRTYNLTLAALIIVAGSMQVRRWWSFPPQERLHWQATALLNLSALLGAAEALHRGTPAGVTVWAISVALTWLLTAVLYRPVRRWRTRRQQPKETP